MFESAELGHSLEKDSYDREVLQLRPALLAAQYELLRAAKFPVILIVSGMDGAGKGDTVNTLAQWLDPRHFLTQALDAPSEEERQWPAMWRFWRALPPKGRIGAFLGSWYSVPIASRIKGKIRNAELDQALEEIAHFERMLADEGALILKFWLHLSKDRQKRRLKALEADPKTRWRVRATDWKHFKLYDRFCTLAERVLRETSTAHAPWAIVEGFDARYRQLTVGKALLAALRRRLEAPAAAVPAAPPATLPTADNLHLLRGLDLSLALTRKQYERQLERYQGKLNLLTRHKRFPRRSVVAVFEGMDAAGKGGAIRRVAAAVNARQLRVHPIAAPSEEERAQPYLWRFWRHVPRLGQIAIFDRSWYGRVLVERVEGYCTEYDWMRAYPEINDFEAQLVHSGAIVVKFWLHISLKEQLRRFKEREATPFKRYKITEDDWRNREKWPLYEQAVCDMVDRTSTTIAPWTLIEAEDKRCARIKVLKTLCRQIEERL
jgi:polyphosphate:AMP phosphotransferase